MMDKWFRKAKYIYSPKEYYLLGVFSLFYFVFTGYIAATKYAWYDELSTWHISFNANPFGFLVGLAHGADVTPPLYFLLAKVSGTILGYSELALRLPAMISFWVFLLVVYTFLSKRFGRLTGWIGIAIGLLNVNYALEGRPYSLVLALGSISFVAWVRATEEKQKHAMKWVLGITLMLAYMSHYYACVLFIIFFVAELGRCLSNRLVKKDILFTIITSASVYLFALPLILVAHSFSAHFWSRPRFAIILTSYKFFLGQSKWQLVAAIIITACTIGYLCCFRPSELPSVHKKNSSYTTVALCLFILVPFMIYIMSFVTHAFAGRYTIVVAIGYAFTIPILIVALSKNNQYLIGGTFMCLILVLIPIFTNLYLYAKYYSNNIQTCIQRLETSAVKNDALPLAITEAQIFADLYHYAPRSLQKRIVYVTDIENEVQYKGFDADFRTLSGAQSVYYLPIMSTDNFLSKYQSFWIVGKPNWLDQPSEKYIPHNYNIKYIDSSFCKI